jgi:hypothetical protein
MILLAAATLATPATAGKRQPGKVERVVFSAFAPDAQGRAAMAAAHQFDPFDSHSAAIQKLAAHRAELREKYKPPPEWADVREWYVVWNQYREVSSVPAYIVEAAQAKEDQFVGFIRRNVDPNYRSHIDYWTITKEGGRVKAEPHWSSQ